MQRLWDKEMQKQHQRLMYEEGDAKVRPFLVIRVVLEKRGRVESEKVREWIMVFWCT